MTIEEDSQAFDQHRKEQKQRTVDLSQSIATHILTTVPKESNSVQRKKEIHLSDGRRLVVRVSDVNDSGSVERMLSNGNQNDGLEIHMIAPEKPNTGAYSTEYSIPRRQLTRVDLHIGTHPHLVILDKDLQKNASLDHNVSRMYEGMLKEVQEILLADTAGQVEKS